MIRCMPVAPNQQAFRTAAWVIAGIALAASLSGWFAVVVGLPLGIVGMLTARVARNQRALLTAVLAVCVALLWVLIDAVR